MSNVTIPFGGAPVVEEEPLTGAREHSLADEIPFIVIGASLGFLALYFVGFGPVGQAAGVIAGAYFGHMGPSIRADRREKARLREVDRQVATVASLLAVTVKAGLGLDAAFETVAAETGGPLGAELAIVVDEIRVGKRRNDALRAMVERTPAPDVRRLTQALHHAEELGGSVYNTLSTLAEDCRSRRFQMARAEAAKLPVKLLFPVVFLIFPPMLIILVGPAMIDITSSF